LLLSEVHILGSNPTHNRDIKTDKVTRPSCAVYDPVGLLFVTVTFVDYGIFNKTDEPLQKIK